MRHRIVAALIAAALIVPVQALPAATPARASTGLPCAPRLDSMVVTNDGAMHLDWTSWTTYGGFCEGGLGILGSNVYIGTTPGGEDYSAPAATVEVNQPYANLTGLTGGVTYYATVTHIWDTGESTPPVESVPSGERSAMMWTQPAAPTIVSAVGGSDSIVVTWEAPADTGGLPLARFDYHLAPKDGTACPAQVTELWNYLADGSATSGTITGLTGGTYCVSVNAMNTEVSGPQSAVLEATVGSIPSAPSLWKGGVGNGSITLLWDAPANDGASPVTGYNVYVGTASGQETKSAASPIDPVAAWDGARYSYTLTGLPVDGTTVYMYVTAVNAQGEGRASNEIAEIPVITPAAPTELHAAATVTRKTLSATIGWLDDPAASGHVTGHEVGVYTWKKSRTGGTYTFVKTVSLTGENAAATLSGLSSRYAYAFTARTRTVAGWGGWSGYSTIVP